MSAAEPLFERPLGWVDEPEPTLAQRAASKLRAGKALLGALSRPPSGGFMREPWILQQQGESCTGHFAAQSMWALYGEKMSPYFPWFWGRVHDSLDILNIMNVGVSMSALKTALRAHGTCPYDMWNPSTTNFTLNAKPGGAARAEAQKRNFDVVSIYDRGAAGLAAVLDALWKGFPVGIVVDVDDGFDRPPADGIIGPVKGTSRGKHIVTGWYYHAAPGERAMVKIVNSWSRRWGLSGVAWLDESRIREAPALCIVRSAA